MTLRTYTIYFELFGKKMKTEIKAITASGAIIELKEKIIIHKVIPSKDDLPPGFEFIFDKINEKG